MHTFFFECSTWHVSKLAGVFGIYKEKRNLGEKTMWQNTLAGPIDFDCFEVPVFFRMSLRSKALFV